MPIHPNSNPNMDMRPPSYMLTPDYRIYQMNRRLQEYRGVKDCDAYMWWDMFTTEFFDESATLTLSFFLEDGPKRYTIGRTLIPRFYRTMFDSGITEFSIALLLPKEYHNSSTNALTLDCDKATMVMQHDDLISTKVCAEGHLIADFAVEDAMRIRSWHFTIRSHSEYISKHTLMQNPAMLEEMCKNVTRAGLTPAIINYLKMCVVIEPMKELMSRQKTYKMDPRDCLRNCLFQKWQRMLHPTDTTRPTKRNPRKRKNSSTNNSTNNSQGPRKKGFSSSDVMMVGEPTLMSQEFGEEDERMIQRLENNQFDNQMQVKSEDRETSSSSFPSMSPPTSGAPQWQHQPTSSAIQTSTSIVPKSEPTDPSAGSTPPITTSM